MASGTAGRSRTCAVTEPLFRRARVFCRRLSSASLRLGGAT